MCIGIIRNNSLVDERAWAESNPGHWARHALLHMVAECVNHSATKAGQVTVSKHRKKIQRSTPDKNYTFYDIQWYECNGWQLPTSLKLTQCICQSIYGLNVQVVCRFILNNTNRRQWHQYCLHSHPTVQYLTVKYVFIWFTVIQHPANNNYDLLRSHTLASKSRSTQH